MNTISKYNRAKMTIVSLCWVAMFAACEHRPVQGVVVHKEYRPARMVEQYNANRQMTEYATFPQEWIIGIEDTATHETTLYHVTEDDYNRVSVGQFITEDRDGKTDE